MASEYDKNKITKTYFNILVCIDMGKGQLEECDEISEKHCPQDLVGACKRVIELVEHDKDFKD